MPRKPRKSAKKLDAAKMNLPKGKGDRTWSDVAGEMTVILDQAYEAAASGKGDEGSTLVNNAYYQYYEKLGFEKERDERDFRRSCFAGRIPVQDDS